MSRLLERLPPELRLMIYELAFVTPAEVNIHDIIECRPSYNMLLSCRQIHDEAKSAYEAAAIAFRHESDSFLPVTKASFESFCDATIKRTHDQYFPKDASNLSTLTVMMIDLATNEATAQALSSEARFKVFVNSENELRTQVVGTSSLRAPIRRSLERIELIFNDLRMSTEQPGHVNAGQTFGLFCTLISAEIVAALMDGEQCL